VPLLGAAVSAKALRQAEEGNPAQVASPMPGTVARVAVKQGQRVLKGDVLASIEAMKMESLVLAEREATVKAIHVRHGDAVPAKALLMELAD
jgi:pyruvate carboxylase